MAMKLSLIFYGSSYVGFDIMKDIDPLLGPPLMYIFVTLSSILLMGSLTGKLALNPISSRLLALVLTPAQVCYPIPSLASSVTPAKNTCMSTASTCSKPRHQTVSRTFTRLSTSLPSSSSALCVFSFPRGTSSAPRVSSYSKRRISPLSAPFCCTR